MIKFTFKGFDELLSEIEKAGGNINSATKKCMNESAKIYENELKNQMAAADVPTRLINAMPSYEVTEDGGKFTARVGYRKGTYDPDNITDAYKVVFLNYGTPHRSKHGKIKARGFIQKARTRAKSKVKKVQEETLNDLLKGLKNG